MTTTLEHVPAGASEDLDDVVEVDSTGSSTADSPAVVRVTAQRYGLSEKDLEAFGAELDAIRDRVRSELGQSDVDYLRRVITVQRGLATTGRASLFLGFLPPFWLLGAGSLSVSKILDNMEIGHNIMHGQFDWTRDPELSSQTFDWDTACPADQWRHSHNYLHHTFTNIVGKDRDIGYGFVRISDAQRWNVSDLVNPLKATFLMLIFDQGVMLHDVEINDVLTRKKPVAEAWPKLREGLKKSARLAGKDLVLWPILTGPMFLSTLAANATANLARNVWTFSIIFCGHFPEGTHEFTVDECEDESRGHWYFRQILGSANIRGARLFHVLSGNLSHQIEHHLFPDLPANRYQEIAPDVEALTEKYGIPYNKRGFAGQLGSTWKKILRFVLPS